MTTPDTRMLGRDINLPIFFEMISADRRKVAEQIQQLLNGTCEEHDNLDQILDEFAFHVRFEALYLMQESSTPTDQAKRAYNQLSKVTVHQFDIKEAIEKTFAILGEEIPNDH